MYMHGIVDDRDYSDYAKDYGHLGNILTDIAHGVGSIISNIWGVIKPVAPQLIYQGATGQPLPPSQTIVQQQTKPATPITTYLMYGGAALIAGLVILKATSRSGRR